MNMRNMLFPLATLVTFLMGPAQAASPGSHNFFDVISPEFETEDWEYGCILYNILYTPVYDNTTWMRNECYVIAPAGSPVLSYGFDFSSNGLAHWSTGSATGSNFANSGNWNYNGAEDNSKDIDVRIKNNSDGVRYWDGLNFVFNFWYEPSSNPNTRSYIQYGSSNQSNRRGAN